ncbi:MAG: transketolase [bacterium]
MRKQFKDTFFDLAKSDPRVVMILGDISVYMFRDFQAQFPDRFYNMGICEQTLISAAAGLRSQGFIPVVHTIGAFLTERAMEQIKIDLVYNDYPACLVSCGGTVDWAWDGPSHQAWVDVSFMRNLPKTQVFQPGTKKETDFLIRRHYADPITSYFRLSDFSHPLDLKMEAFRGIVVKRGQGNTTVITAGAMLDPVLKASEGLDVTILYFHTIKPFDHELVSQFANTKLKVVHDSHGLFEAVCEVAGRSVEKLGLPDHFCGCYGTVNDARRDIGLDVGDIGEFLRK